MFTNPAMTGFMNSKFRVSSIYRNQWSTVSRGYNTFLASAECQPYIAQSGKSGLGIGLSFTSDVAGSLSYGEQDIGVSFSCFFTLNRSKTAFLSFGILGQRENWGYNSSQADFNQEGIYNDDIRYEDLTTYSLSFGSMFQYNLSEDNQFQAGASIFNLNEPSLSYFDNSTDKSKIHRRYSLTSSYMFACNDRYSVRPQIQVNQQYRYNEFIVGSDFIIKLDDAIFTQNIFSIGVYVRNGESIIFSPKYKYNNFLAGLSYDVNISALSKVSKTYGAIEFWLSYSFDPVYYGKHKNTKIPCPIF